MVNSGVQFLSGIESNPGTTFCPNSKSHYLDDEFTAAFFYAAADHSMEVLDEASCPGRWSYPDFDVFLSLSLVTSRSLDYLTHTCF